MPASALIASPRVYPRAIRALTASARPPKKRSAASFLFYLAIFAVLIISWLPYTMTFMPFGVFSDTNSVIRQATGLYYGNRAGFNAVRKHGMAADFSWKNSAAAYRALYQSL